MTISLHVSEELQQAAMPFIERLCVNRFASRLRLGDASLWGAEAEAEATGRLGWVDPFEKSGAVLQDAAEMRESLLRRDMTQIVLCGMGGSSLGPEVVARGYDVPLLVLDTTHPAEISRALAGDLARTTVVVSSKSGSTIETLSQLRAFQSAFEAEGFNPSEHIVVVTDPGTPLSEMEANGYHVFLADPNMGGRFSVLGAFGIVPTVLAGADMSIVLSDARSAQEQLFTDSLLNPALQLAAALFSALPQRYVMLLDELAQSHSGLGDWVEQLVAESTGKSGQGLLPISLSSAAPEFDSPPDNAVIVSVCGTNVSPQGIAIDATLGEQFLLWEVATSAIGYLMGINPFDQPDVESAKIAARSALQEGTKLRFDHEALNNESLVEALRAIVTADGYVALQAFLDRSSPAAQRAYDLRDFLATTLRVPVSLGWGPRYLHSTGQFHKGGPELGVFVQLLDQDCNDLNGTIDSNSFGQLLRAQADGDRKVLEERGRPVLTRSI